MDVRALLLLTLTGGALLACDGSSSSDTNSALDRQQIDTPRATGTLEQYLKTGLIEYYSADNSVPIAVDAPAPEIAAEPAPEAAAGDSSGFSTTNVQEAGVDEADLFKQNGQYLYALEQPSGYGYFGEGRTAREVRLHTYRTETSPVTSQHLSTLTLPGAHYADGIFLVDDQLIALTQAYTSSRVDQLDGLQTDLSGNSDIAWCGLPYETQSVMTEIRMLDSKQLSTSQPQQPAQTLSIAFEGRLIDSRRVGDTLYLATAFSPEVPLPHPIGYDLIAPDATSVSKTIEGLALSDLLPRIWVNGEPAGTLFDDGECHLPAAEQGGFPQLTALIKVDLNAPERWEALCNSGRVSSLYSSPTSIVLTGYHTSSSDTTRVDWYDLAQFELIASGTLPGTLGGGPAAFRLQERDGTLHIITSSRQFDWWASIAFDDVESNVTSSVSTVSLRNDWDHRLYVLQPDASAGLDLIAALPNAQRPAVIGKPGEEIKSVRFRGDRAYIVTFQRTDPLYVVNLSNPVDPYIEGELEITGFSTYLHPLNDRLVLGLGQTATASGITTGPKLSIFDISTPGKPQEITVVPLGDGFTYSEALYDHHALQVLALNEHTNRIGFTLKNAEYSAYIADIDLGSGEILEQLNLPISTVAAPLDSGLNAYIWYPYTRVGLQGSGYHLVLNGEVFSGAVID